MTSKWDSSRRRLELPANWSRLRRQVLREAEGRCEIRLAGCVGEASEVDHIRRGDDHSRSNLRAVCRRCHALKSSAEGNARLAELRRLRRRPEGRHPGGV
jgi:5-methylcytosine-specific restriction endonuclease McrA